MTFLETALSIDKATTEEFVLCYFDALKNQNQVCFCKSFSDLDLRDKIPLSVICYDILLYATLAPKQRRDIPELMIKMKETDFCKNYTEITKEQLTQEILAYYYNFLQE